MGAGDKTVARYDQKGKNISVTNKDKSKRVRLEFSEKSGKNITPHGHVEVKNDRGKWVPAPNSPDHINFKSED